MKRLLFEIIKCLDFFLADFDINQWYTSEGINPNAVLSLVDREKLLNKLGISSYLSVNPCSFSSDTYSPANAKGWKNGQFYSLINL